MESIISWLEQYGLATVFINVGLEQPGLPVPAYPVLIFTDALRVGGRSQMVATFIPASRQAVDDVLTVLANLGRKPLASSVNTQAAPGICRA